MFTMSPNADSRVVLEVKNLVKTFPKVEAVKGISFEVKKGECLGLLGPNGAGKTTTIEILEGIQKPTSGEILYLGKPVTRDFQKVAGIQFQKTSLPDYLTCRDVLKLFQSFYENTLPIETMVEWCALEEYLDRDVHKLSGGQRQRLLLALALIHDPEIVFLDEPTTGLDPHARRNFWELVNQIKSKGKTVLLTTHYMDEAFQLCDRILIVDHGKILIEGDPRTLLSQHFNQKILELDSKLAPLFADSQAFTFKPIAVGSHLEIHTTEIEGTLSELVAQKIPLESLTIRSHTLEDLFIELTGKELRPE